ncbi:MAG: hypothetical protein QOH17_1932, partial [Pseudonocardiales bacterium]|nr:hypothetical protein [Pseudonocardiales bacterium]
MTQQPQERAEADDRASAGPAGLVRVLALVGAALSLVFYLLGFVSDVGTTGLVGALVIGGGLLAGVGVLPRTGRLLAPAAVVSVVGLLALLQVVVSSRATGLVIGALAVAFLQTIAVVGALLADTRIVGAPARRPKQAAPAVENAPYGAVSPDQAWTQEHLGNLHQVGAPGGDLTKVYGAPPQYGDTPDNTALIAAPAAGAFPVGEPGSVPAFGLSSASAPKDATEVVPASAYGAGLTGATAVNGAVAGARGQTPVDAAYGAGAVNGDTGVERGQAPGDAPAPSYGLTGANAVNGPAPGAQVYGLGGAGAANPAAPAERGPAADAQRSAYGPGSPNGATAGQHGAAAQALGEGQVPLYGLSGASAVNGAQAPEHSPSGAPHGVPGEVPAPLYGLSGRGAHGTGGQRGPSGQAQNGAADPSAARYGENGQPAQLPGAPGERSAPQYGLTGSHGRPNERVTTSGPAPAVPAEGPALLQGLTGPARSVQTGPSSVPADAPLYGLSGPGQAGSPGERGNPGQVYGQPGAANERGWSGYNAPGEAQASPYGPAGATGERGQAHNNDGSVQLSGLSGTGALNGRASTSGPSHAVPG